MASETSAIALRSEEIRKEMPIATASDGGVANLSHDLFFMLLYNITFFCIQRNRFYNGIVSEIKLFQYEKLFLQDIDPALTSVIVWPNYMISEYHTKIIL